MEQEQIWQELILVRARKKELEAAYKQLHKDTYGHDVDCSMKRKRRRPKVKVLPEDDEYLLAAKFINGEVCADMTEEKSKGLLVRMRKEDNKSLRLCFQSSIYATRVGYIHEHYLDSVADKMVYTTREEATEDEIDCVRKSLSGLLVQARNELKALKSRISETE